MKKKILTGLSIIVIAIIFVGFGFTKNVEIEKEYQRAMDRGIEAVKKMHYQAAKIDFQDALKRKPNDRTAKQNLNQLNFYINAKKELKNKNYQQASAIFKQVATQEHGINVLVRRATAYYTELDEAEEELAVFKKHYQKAVDLSDEGNYSASNHKLSLILEYRNIDQSYYDQIRTKAKQLKESNDKNIPNEQSAPRNTKAPAEPEPK